MRAGGEPGTEATEATDVVQEYRIGSGGTCTVYKGKTTVEGKQMDVALKYFNTEIASKILKNEYKVMKNLRHNNIIQLFAFIPSQSLLVLELCGVCFEGDILYDLYSWSKAYKLRSESVDYSLLVQTLDGLEFLHSQNIVHADMKPMNCLTKDDVHSPTIKLADFGLAYSQVITTTQTQHSSIGKGRGTDIYKGPESADPSAKWRTFANDLYSFAFSAVELLFPDRETGYGHLLGDSPTTFSVLRLKMSGIQPPIEDPPAHWNKSEWECLSPILGNCFSFNPSERPQINILHKDIRHLKMELENTRMTETSEKVDQLNLDAPSQAFDKTVPFSSTPISSQPIFDLGDTSEIFFDLEVPLERNYKNFALDCQVEIKSIGLSQNTPLEAIMSQVYKMPLPVLFFPAFSQFIETCKATKDPNSLVTIHDATNSCTFLAVEIAMNITQENIGNVQRIAADAGDLILSGPPRYNKDRDKDIYYNIDDALDILKIQARVGFSCDFSHSNKEDLIKNVRNNLQHIMDHSVGKTARIIYICPPLSFVLCCSQSCITMVDSHMVPPTEHGAVMSWSGDVGIHVQEAAAKTIFARLYFTVKQKIFEENHSMSVLIGKEEEMCIPENIEKGMLVVPPMEPLLAQTGLPAPPRSPTPPRPPAPTEQPVESEEQDQVAATPLRPHQQEVIDRIVDRRQDTIMIWATGAGKTFTTLKAMEMLSKSTLMIIPTLSLMMDISSELRGKDIGHTVFSSLNVQKFDDMVEGCLRKQNCNKVLLATPEYIVRLGQVNFFNHFHEQIGIDMIVTEEAHCDLLWNSFRKDILTAKKVLQPLTHVVRVAITASPPGGDEKLTAELSDLSNYYTSKYGLFRKELFLRVVTKKEIKSIIDIVQPGQKQIIFCHASQSVINLTETLQEDFENVFPYYGSLSTEDKVSSQKDFEASKDGILISTKAQAFGVNYTKVNLVIIYEVPDGLELLYQMMGRASREGNSGQILIVYSPKIIGSHFYHLNQNQDNEKDDQLVGILRSSLMAIQDLAEKFVCRWRTILLYFNALPDNNFQCGICDVCCENERSEEDITKFAKPILQFLADNYPVTYTTLKAIIGGQASELNKVDNLTKERVKGSSLENLCKKMGLSKAEGIRCLDDLRGNGLLDSTANAIPGQKSTRMMISQKGREALLLPKIMVHSKKKMEMRKGKITFERTDLCHLPTDEQVQELPFEERTYSLPDNVDAMLSQREMTDEFLEVAFQTPVIKGNVAFEFQDSDGFVCVPREIIDNLYCPEHNTIKSEWGRMLAGFQKYPRIISWKQAYRWIGKNSFQNKKDYTGINLDFSCSQQKDGCMATLRWKSVGLRNHSNNEHVLFQTLFRSELKHESDETITLNTHIHPIGSEIACSKTTRSEAVCCQIMPEIIQQPYKKFTDRTFIKTVKHDTTNPIRAAMISNVEALQNDPYAFQGGQTVVSHAKMRNIQQQKRLEDMPWLKGIDPKQLSMAERIIRLGKYLDEEHWTREKKEGNYKENRKYPYFIDSVTNTNDGITIIITDLIGLKLFLKCAKNGVIGIDGTGRGSDTKGQIMQYSITGDVSKFFKRSDKAKGGILSLADFFFIGKGVTNTANLEYALLQLKKSCLSYLKEWVEPQYVKLDGERGLCNAVKIWGPGVRRLVEKNHANRNLEKNLFVNGPLKGNAEEQAIFFRMWQRFCQANSWLEANVLRDEIKSYYEDDPESDKILQQLQLYFDDPAMICSFGRSGLSEDLIQKHEGPAEVESLFDKYKHHYGDRDKDDSKHADVILYGFHAVRDRLRTRFLVDFQNSKLPVGRREVSDRYSTLYGCEIDPPSPRKPRASLKPVSRKSKRQISDDDNNQSSSKKSKLAEDIFASPASVAKNLSFEEGDMNVPLDKDKGKASISSYSKSKTKRSQNLRRLLKVHKPKTDKVLMQLENKIDDAKRSEEIDINIPCSQYTTVEECDQDFQALTKNTPTDVEVSSVKGKDLIMANSQHIPDFSCWKTLNVVSHETAENLAKVPINLFFDISTSSPVYSIVRMVLDLIVSDEDTFTKVEQCCFRYVRETAKNMIFLFLYVMTNKGVVRNKDMPFMFQYILPFGRIESNDQTIPLEAVYQITPRRSIFTEDLLQVRLDTKVSLDIRNSLVKTFKKHYSPDTDQNIINFSSSSTPKRFDKGIDKNSIGIIKVKKIKENPVAVHIIGFDDVNVLLTVLQPVAQSSLRWRNPGGTTASYPRDKLLATSVPADITENSIYILRQSPRVVLKGLGLN